MARQKLGKKKHKKCEDITGRVYEKCLVRGGGEHFVAHCIYKEDNYKYDLVNYKTGEFKINND